MTSDNEIAKKEAERHALEHFLLAYKFATGQFLEVIQEGESPDFLCVRQDQTEIGLELARITHGPVEKHWDWVLDGRTELEPFDAQSLIYSMISKKEAARTSRYVHRASQCILVLQLEDGSLESIRHVLDGLEEDFNDHGFAEIWIADFSALDAYGNVELYGLFPSEYFGFYTRPNHDSKPYG